MRRAVLSAIALLFSSASLAQSGTPLCVIDPAEMPESWRPAPEIAAELDPGPWSAEEAADATASIAAGVDEMIAYFAKNPAGIPEMWEDAVAALIEVTYSSANAPALDARITEAASRNLSVLVAPYLAENPDEADCSDYAETVPLALYAHRFYGPDDSWTRQMIETANAAYDDCGSFSRAIGVSWPEVLSDKSISGETVFDLVIWSLIFIQAEVVPGLIVPEEMKLFSPILWQFLQTYEIEDASAYEDGAEDDAFIEDAYLATHIAYIPTGNHRHPLYVEDMPWLYRFHRENFYPILEMGELDLVAEVVDSLRQYGCTPENDIQVRDGTRYLLGVFRDGGDNWMAYREPGETDAELEAYDLIHKTWTGVLGVRERDIEPAEPGTYGGIVRRWLPAP
jgi:hypothetical protein